MYVIYEKKYVYFQKLGSDDSFFHNLFEIVSKSAVWNPVNSLPYHHF